MKFYLAARFGLKEIVQQLQQELQRRGHEIVGDWTNHKPIKPYDQHPDLARAYSVGDVEGVRASDVFCLLSDEAGTGMYTELGVAISCFLDHRKPHIYVVGAHNARNMFYFHDVVQKLATKEQFLAEVDRLEALRRKL